MRWAVAIAAVFLLAGCSTHVPPPSYTDAELEVYLDGRLDAAWANTGLEGLPERPVVDGTTAERFESDNFFELSGCMSAAGLTSWGLSEQDGGPVFTDGTGAQLTPDLRLAVYRCVAQYPVSDNFSNILLTPDQKRYLYDYYRAWLVPCLIAQRYDLDLSYAPDEETFVTGPGDWNPYYSMTDGPGYSVETGLGEIRRLALVKVCGGQFADLDVVLPDMSASGG